MSTSKFITDFQSFLAIQKAKSVVDSASLTKACSDLGLNMSDVAVLDNNNLALSVFAEDEKDIRAKRPAFSDKTIHDEAYPGGVFVGEADGEGGLVESPQEARKKMLDIVNKVPSKIMLHGLASEAVSDFIKMANHFDKKGLFQEADELEAMAVELKTYLISLADDKPEIIDAHSADFADEVPADIDFGDKPKKKVMHDVRNINQPNVKPTGLGGDPVQPSFFTEEPDVPGKTPGFDMPGPADVIDAGDGAKVVPGTVKNRAWYKANLGDVANKTKGRTGNILKKIVSLVPFFGGVNVPAAAAGASILAGVGLYKWYTGSLQESFTEDLRDLTEEINDAADVISDAKEKETAMKYVSEMKSAAAGLRETKALLDSAGSDPSAIFTGIQQITQYLDHLRQNFTLFEQEASALDLSFIRQTMGFGFPSLQNTIEDIEAHVTDSVAALEKAYTKELTQFQAAPAARSESPEVELSQAPGLTPEEDKDRIVGIQRFLKQRISSASDLITSGEFDDNTIRALDEFTDLISNDLGVGNFTTSRIMESGDFTKMQQVYDLWRRSDQIRTQNN